MAGHGNSAAYLRVRRPVLPHELDLVRRGLGPRQGPQFIPTEGRGVMSSDEAGGLPCLDVRKRHVAGHHFQAGIPEHGVAVRDAV